MAAVLPPQHSQNLLQRRMNQAQYSQPTGIDFMPTNHGFDVQTGSQGQLQPRNDLLSATEHQFGSNIGRFQSFPQPHANVNGVPLYPPETPQSSILAQSQSAPLVLDTDFANSFQYPMSFSSSMSALPQLGPHTNTSPHWGSNIDYVPMSAPATQMRNDSMSAFSSSPTIKSEEDSILQAMHEPHGVSAVPRTLSGSQSFDSGDSADAQGDAFHTSIDVLMKAIQSRTKGHSDHSRRVCYCRFTVSTEA